MKINVIGSGSSGNAILFEGSILLDIGLPYISIKEYSSALTAVLMTHIHGDHFKPSAVRALHLDRPDLKFLCGDFMIDPLLDAGIPYANIIEIECGKVYAINGIKISPVELEHDVRNFGYRILSGGEKHFHATDVANLTGITALGYDSATLECNHDLEAAQEIIRKAYIESTFTHMKRTISTHLNVDKAIKFIEENKIKRFIPVHLGAATKIQVNKKLKDFSDSRSKSEK